MPTSGESKKRSFLNDDIWSEVLIRYMKMERIKQNYTLQELSAALEKEYGIIQTEGNLKNKFNRGNYGAQLLLMSLQAMGVSQINMDEIREIYKSVEKEKSASES